MINFFSLDFSKVKSSNYSYYFNETSLGTGFLGEQVTLMTVHLWEGGEGGLVSGSGFIFKIFNRHPGERERERGVSGPILG